MTEFALDLRKVAAMVESSDVWLHDVRVDQATDFITGKLIHRITGYILADHLASDRQSAFRDFPASWWQHTKAAHFPTVSRWLRRPPRYVRDTVTFTVDTSAVFPQASVPYPLALGPVRIHQQDRIEWVRDADPRGSEWLA